MEKARNQKENLIQILGMGATERKREVIKTYFKAPILRAKNKSSVFYL